MLYQLPPSLHKNVERLDAFLARLPGDLMHVVEFRHNSWYDQEVLALLDRHNVGFVVHDLRGLISPRWASGRTAYIRFHGTSGRYHGRYGAEILKDWAEWCREQRDLGRSVWCYFNNDIHGHALADAQDLKAILAS